MSTEKTQPHECGFSRDETIERIPSKMVITWPDGQTHTLELTPDDLEYELKNRPGTQIGSNGTRWSYGDLYEIIGESIIDMIEE